MALFKIDKTYFDTFEVLTEPTRTFSSSSVGGITGAIRVFPLASIGLKEILNVSAEGEPPIDSSPDILRGDILAAFQTSGSLTGSAAEAAMQGYLDSVTSSSITLMNQKQVEVLRFEPSYKFTSDTLRKGVVQNVLFPFYRPRYPTPCNWSFTNYHTVNFFTAAPLPNKAGLRGSGAKVFGSIPKQSALIYPFMTASRYSISSSCYRPSTAFAFDFWINPRYGQDTRADVYHAGTLFHCSSSYAVSLVSGSRKDPNGFVDGFRLLLQLSHSAEIPPSSCSLDTGVIGQYPRDLIFSSSDNSLTKNKWHHCCVRWGGKISQQGTGSFVIDGIERGTFIIPSASIRQEDFPGAGPDALFVGNFYEGPNGKTSPDDSYIAQFFHPAVARNDGLPNYYPSVSYDSDSDLNKDPQRAGGPKGGLMTYVPGYALDHPLRAEVHELKIYNKYRNLAQIDISRTDGVQYLDIERDEGLMFYVPPFFVKNTKVREILQTPFQSVMGSTDDPYNVPLAFGVGGHYLNLENFVKDFASGQFPRLLNLSASTLDTSTGWLSANDFLYATGSVAKRNLTILPCDNGGFKPNFDLLRQDAYQNVGPNLTGESLKKASANAELALSLFVNDSGRQNLSMISLNNLLATGSSVVGGGVGQGQEEKTGSISADLAGPTPDDPSIPTGSILTIFNRTRDATSDEVVFFDASNLFYGDRIKSGSYILNDDNLTGSNGQVGITFKDDGRGNLYRCDASGSHPTWASAGTLLYDEGLAVIKTPVLPRFGIDQFKVSMVGERKVYVLQISVPAEAGELDFSSNPDFEFLRPSALSADVNEDFVYLTTLNFLDENLNVICKNNFSQAMIKRVNDRFIVRIRLDF